MKAKLAIFAFGGAALLLAADKPVKPATRVEELEAKVSGLESRLQRVEAQLASIRQSQTVHFETPTLLPNPSDSTIPPHRGEIEVNGMKFYLVPLSQPMR
jgi:hypothetical protein